MKPQTLLARQLRRQLGLDDAAAVGAFLDALDALAAQPPAGGGAGGIDLARALRGMRGLLAQVDETYAQYDRDLTLGSRSLAISSQELLQAYERIREEARAQQRVLASLRKAVQRLALGAGMPEVTDDDVHLEELSARLWQLVSEHAAAKARLQTSEERLNLALTASDTWIWDWDRARGTLHIISNAPDILGLPIDASDPPLHVWRDAVAADELRLLSRALRRHLRGGAPQVDVALRVRAADGALHVVQIRGKVVAWDSRGHPRRLAGTARDTTELHEAHDALRRAKEAADAANTAKSAFLANTSHEIRTPLNGLLGIAELLQAEPLAPSQRDKVRLIESAGRNLLGVLNDILDYSKIEAGRLELETIGFDLRELVERCARLHAPQALDKQLKLEVDVGAELPAACIGDPLRLQQVLNNLLGNAIKFTGHGRVVLRMRRAARPAAGAAPLPAAADAPPRTWVRIEVEDTGIGMPAPVAAALFRPFMQADASTTRRFGGTGLGLAISKHIVEMLGGTIGVESEPDRGSLFWFELPLLLVAADADRTAPAAPHRDAPDLAGRRVLVVEDNPLNLLVVSAMLELVQADITPAGDGEQALMELYGKRFDIVLMDCQMPVMDGFEAARRWRAEEAARAWPRTPIVALTANALAGDRERCLEAGFDDHLGKPFTRAQLEGILARWARVR